MFVYCTDGLGYSESSANRRICAARAIRKCPEAYDYLRDGRVNLSTLSIAWKYLTPELLDEIAGKSQRQVFAIVARFEPRIKHRDNTWPVMVMKRVVVQHEGQPARAFSNGSCGLALAALERENAQLGQNHHRSGGKKLTTDTPLNSSNPKPGDDTSAPPQTTDVKMETVKMHQVNCLVDDAVMQMLDRCKELLSGKHPCGIDYNTLIMELASDWLERHDPVSRSERRAKRKKSKNLKTTNMLKNIDPEDTSRYISPATRDTVYNRDEGRCTYVGSNGKRCESKWDLEIHHDETPFAMGGGHSLRNLSLLCAVHNKLESERVYGRRHMEKYFKQQE